MSEPESETANPEITSTVKLSLVITKALDDELKLMAHEAGITKSDVLRKAIVLYTLASDVKRQHKHLVVLKGDEMPTEIIGI